MKKTTRLLFFVFIASIMAGCKINQDIIPQSQIISLTTGDVSKLNADGQATFSLTAKISDSTDIAYRNVTFNASTNLGTFNGSTNSTSNVVAADVSGLASTSIKVGTIPGTYYVSAQVSNGTSVFKTPDIPVTLLPLAFSDKLTLTADNLQPVADGLSVINLKISSKYELNNQLKLTTNFGSFTQSATPLSYSLLPDNQGNASTTFQLSNQVTPHIINAAFPDGTNATLTINPLPSYTDVIFAQLSALVVDNAGGSVGLTVFLRKNDPNAKVSMNSPVFFDAYQVIGGVNTHVGRFTNLQLAVSDASGNIPVVNFFADTGDINPALPIIITISANSTSTTKTSVALQVSIKK